LNGSPARSLVTDHAVHPTAKRRAPTSRASLRSRGRVISLPARALLPASSRCRLGISPEVRHKLIFLPQNLVFPNLQIFKLFFQSVLIFSSELNTAREALVCYMIFALSTSVYSFFIFALLIYVNMITRFLVKGGN
jgi:hypothetical protein